MPGRRAGTDSEAPGALPGVREYLLRGVFAHVEIGLGSDIRSITWVGN